MEPVAFLRFAASLRPLVRRAGPDGMLSYPVTRRASIKDVLEAVGVPHTEVYGLWAAGVSLPFTAPLKPDMLMTP